MGNPQDIDRDTAGAVDTASPGQRLRAARETRQLTREAIAAQLRIDTKAIEALERNDYTQLPAAVFVRGYLRAYAKLVGLSPEPLVESFDARTAQAPPPLVLPAAVGPDIEARGGYARWLVFALAVLSLLLFYQWWQMEGGKPEPAVTQAPPAAPATPPPEAPIDASQVPPIPETGVALESLYGVPADESGLDTVNTALPMPVLADADAVAPVAAAAAPAKTPEPQAVPQMEAATEVASGPLVMRFSADCWVVVRDAGGKALLQGLIKSGERHVLDGKPPYQVTLGNSPAVAIEYLGQPFDQSRYTGASQVARFSLGQ